ncbi:MAG: class I SAM-dependent methyltransferase [Ignavibacteriaceae bacterium]
MDAWYDRWFNSPEYISVYKHRDSAEAEKLVNLILKRINPPPLSKIIDLACGFGRHSISFAEKGFNVTGIDLSKTLIEIAQTDSLERKLSIRFIQHDLSTLLPSHEYFMAVNLFTSFGYYTEDDKNFKIFSIANSQLTDEGYFVFDFFNSEYVRENLREKDEKEFNETKIVQTRKTKDGAVHKTITLTKGDKTNKYDEYVKLYSPDILTSELTKSGFRILDLYGDYNGSNFHIKESQRFLALCQKVI